MSALTDRLRGIVTPGPTGPGVRGDDERAGLPSSNVGRVLLDPPAASLERTLGGEWRDGCFVVEREWGEDARHGRVIVGDLAAAIAAASDHAPMFAAGAPARAPLLFFDLETTGLNGGAGTQAFLVGLGTFAADGTFRTQQFLLTRAADERTLLAAVAARLSGCGALVSFNGKSFDAPLLEMRCAFQRIDWAGARLPHVDALHPARRFWGEGRHPADCSLGALEQRLLGVRRRGDVDGFEVPARYFQYVRTGDPRPLAAVLEHNRLDLLTLAALTARLLELARGGPGAARSAREALALGTVYARAGHDARARDCFARAIELSKAPAGAFDPVRVDSLRALALAWRRARRFDDAAGCWRQLLDVRGCPPAIAREATEALAIHHEHRVRDLALARAFALKGLDRELPPAWTQAAQHRLARIERKMGTLLP